MIWSSKNIRNLEKFGVPNFSELVTLRNVTLRKVISMGKFNDVKDFGLDLEHYNSLI